MVQMAKMSYCEWFYQVKNWHFLNIFCTFRVFKPKIGFFDEILKKKEKVEFKFLLKILLFQFRTVKAFFI